MDRAAQRLAIRTLRLIVDFHFPEAERDGFRRGIVAARGTTPPHRLYEHRTERILQVLHRSFTCFPQGHRGLGVVNAAGTGLKQNRADLVRLLHEIEAGKTYLPSPGATCRGTDGGRG